MTEETQQINKPTAPHVESVIWGVSLRGWLAVVIIGTMCVIELSRVLGEIGAGTPVSPIGEPFRSVITAVITAYYLQKSSTVAPPTKP